MSISRSTLLSLVPGVALAVLASIAVYFAIAGARNAGSSGATLVANADVPAGTVIDSANVASLFKVAQLPSGEAPSDGFSSYASVEGRVISETIPSGQPLRATQLVALASGAPGGASPAGTPVPGSPAGTTLGPAVAALLQPGEVAVIIPASEQVSVGGAVRPGDKVDVIATIPGRAPDGSQRLITSAVLRELRVLATGNQTSLAAGESRAAPYTSLTVAVSAGDALLVQQMLASNIRMALAIRRPDDPSGSSVPATTLEDVIRRAGGQP
jgi:pilus assembly protein CpaB